VPCGVNVLDYWRSSQHFRCSCGDRIWSYLERFSTCSRPNCSCHQGKRHGPRRYVVITRDKAQRQIYVPQTQVDIVRAGIQQYHRLLEIVDRITAINLELMQRRVLNESVKKGYP